LHKLTVQVVLDRTQAFLAYSGWQHTVTQPITAASTSSVSHSFTIQRSCVADTAERSLPDYQQHHHFNSFTCDVRQCLIPLGGISSTRGNHNCMHWLAPAPAKTPCAKKWQRSKPNGKWWNRKTAKQPNTHKLCNIHANYWPHEVENRQPSPAENTQQAALNIPPLPPHNQLQEDSMLGEVACRTARGKRPAQLWS